VKHAVNAQVAFRGRGGANRVSLVGVANVQRLAVNLGVHFDGLDVHLAACAHHAYGNFSAISDEDFAEHVSPCMAKPCRQALTANYTRFPAIAEIRAADGSEPAIHFHSPVDALLRLGPILFTY